MSTCKDHAALVGDMARESQARRDLERERDVSDAAILRLESRVDAGFKDLDKRIVGVKLTLAKGIGAMAAIASVPLLVQLVSYLIRVAEAAQ